MILPNVEIKKILFATDLSESSVHAFAYAVSLANHYEDCFRASQDQSEVNTRLWIIPPSNFLVKFVSSFFYFHKCFTSNSDLPCNSLL